MVDPFDSGGNSVSWCCGCKDGVGVVQVWFSFREFSSCDGIVLGISGCLGVASISIKQGYVHMLNYITWVNLNQLLVLLKSTSIIFNSKQKLTSVSPWFDIIC